MRVGQIMALEGLVVLDMGHMLAGPFCAMLLGDLGADVIKVEKPGGDDARRFGPPFINGESAAFMAVNRNKRGICLDLNADGGRLICHQLIKRVDILIENYRPGTMAQLGLSYGDVDQLNSALVYCSISGFGHTGPYRDKRGFDLIAQAMSGLISVTGQPNGESAKVGVPISDLSAGLYATQAILAAYIQRLRSGKGQHLDVSLLDSAISLTVWESSSYFASGDIPEPMGSAHRLLAPYQVFPTADDPIAIAAGNQRTWARLCKVLGREDLVNDERLASNALRTVNQTDLAAELVCVLRSDSAAHWLERLQEAGVPAGPVYNIAQVYQDPHVQVRGMRASLDQGKAGKVDQIGSPIKLSRTPVTFRRSAPALGQHTDEILAWVGLSTSEILQFRETQVVF